MSKLTKTFKAISLVIVITLVVKLLGLLRILFMAKAFGTGAEASAFEAAYRIPDLLFFSIGIAISTSFIPVFTEYLNTHGKNEAINFANNVICALFIVTIVLSALGILFAPWIVKLIYWGFEGYIYDLTVDLVRIMFPIIIFIALSFTFVGVLQSFGEFNVPASISLPANVVNILYLVFFSKVFGIYGYAIAVLLGWSTQMFFQVPALRREGYSFKPVLSFKHKGLRKMMIMVVPVILGTSVQQVNTIINGALASRLGEGAVAALGYANYLYITTAGVIAYAVSAVFFPAFSKMHAVKDYAEFKKTINVAVKAVVFVLFPIMVGMMVLNIPLIKVLLQRGQFDYNSTLLTATVLFFYSIGMIGFGIQEILNRAFYAVQNTKTPMKIAVLGMTLNIVLNFILVRYLNIGGLALAASLASVFISLLLMFRFRTVIPGVWDKTIAVTLWKVLASSALMGIGIFIIYRAFNISSTDKFTDVFIALSVSVICGITIYGVAALALKMEEARIVINTLRNKLGHKTGGSEV